MNFFESVSEFKDISFCEHNCGLLSLFFLAQMKVLLHKRLDIWETQPSFLFRSTCLHSKLYENNVMVL